MICSLVFIVSPFLIAHLHLDAVAKMSALLAAIASTNEQQVTAPRPRLHRQQVTPPAPPPPWQKEALRASRPIPWTPKRTPRPLNKGLSNDHLMTPLCLAVKLFVERVNLEVTVNIIELIVPLVDNFDVKAILASPPLAGVQQLATVSCLRPCLEQEVQRGAVGPPLSRILTQFE